MIVINDVNEAPVAVPDTDTTDENATLTVDVLANDTDIDAGDDPSTFSLDSVSIVPGGSGGSATIVGNALVFDPGTDFDHLDNGVSEDVTIDYSMSDDGGLSASSTVTISVTGSNDSPVAVPDILEPLTCSMLTTSSIGKLYFFPLAVAASQYHPEPQRNRGTQAQSRQ